MIASCVAWLTRIVAGTSVSMPAESIPSPCIFYANHSSHLDFLSLWAALPKDVRSRTRPVAARDYWEASSFRRFFATRVFRALLVDRSGQHVAQLRDQLDEMIAELEREGSLILFPEGTRGTGDELGEFHAGIYLLLKRVPACVALPVHLGNLHRILPKGELLPVPQLSTVRFGVPLRPVDGESRQAFLDRARRSLSELGTP